VTLTDSYMDLAQLTTRYFKNYELGLQETRYIDCKGFPSTKPVGRAAGQVGMLFLITKESYKSRFEYNPGEDDIDTDLNKVKYLSVKSIWKVVSSIILIFIF
jgi:hypothetical protein